MPDCLFCSRDDESANRILCQNLTCFARFDNFPAAEGHVEVVPKRHVESFFDLTGEEAADAYALLAEARRRLAAAGVVPDGFTVGVNEGKAAGRSIDHVHIHLIPRYVGDVPDPRGGVRQVVPNCRPDEWLSVGESADA